MTVSRRKWDPEVEGCLAAEVAHVGVNGVAWFQPASRQNDRRVAQLRDKAEEMFGDEVSGANLEVLLDRLLGTAIRGLASPEQRAAAPEYFGLRSGGCYRKPGLEDRQVSAAQAYSKASPDEEDISALTFRQRNEYERSLIVDVGRAIEQLVKEESNEEDSDEPAPTGLYVRRIELETRLDESLRKPGIVALVGEGGTGKSTLAEEFISRKVGLDRCVIIDASTERDLTLGVREALLELGPEILTLPDSALILRMRQYLEDRRQAPLYLVFDNVEDWDLVSPMLPSRLASRVIITARREFVRSSWPPCITVESLEPQEANEMARRRLPGASDEEINQLRCLHGRAIAIEHVCAALEPKSSAERAVYLATLERDLAKVLDITAGGLGQQALSVIYRQIIGELENDTATIHAVHLLKLYTVYTFHGQHFKYLELCMGVSLEKWGVDAAMGRVAFQSALTILERYRLVNGSFDGRGQPFKVRMHDLTFQVLREIFKESMRRPRLEVLLVLYKEACDALGAIEGVLGENPSEEEVMLVTPLRNFVKDCPNLPLTEGLNIAFNLCFSTINQGLQHKAPITFGGVIEVPLGVIMLTLNAEAGVDIFTQEEIMENMQTEAKK